MAVKPCPSCGSPTAPDARFCRVCGAPVKAFDSSEGQVSPQAQTIPLTDEARSTDGLSIEERRRQNATTSRISRVEVEKILQRRQMDEQAGDDGDGATSAAPTLAATGAEAAVPADREYAAPTTSALKLPDTVAAASQSSPKPVARKKRPRVWLASLVVLTCAAFITALLAYYFIFSARNRRASGSDTAAPAQNAEQQQQSQTASAGDVGPAVSAQPSQEAPSPNMNATAQANKAEAERASHMQAERSRATEANASTSPPPQASPTLAPPKPSPQPSPATTLSSNEHYRRGVELWNSNRQAAVTEFRAAASSNPDAYYYLGLSIAEGRDPRALLRAELVAALEYFQRAQAGPHRAEATRYVDRLGKEFDRRRKQ